MLGLAEAEYNLKKIGISPLHGHLVFDFVQAKAGEMYLSEHCGMTKQNHRAALDDLNNILEARLPGARLLLQSIPGCRDLSLYLLDPVFDDRYLPHSVCEAISDDPPYWIFCWASGRALAQLILSGQLDVRGKRVVDFGAGSGVVAVTAAKAGAREVIACEIDSAANKLIRLNASVNQVEVRCVDRLELLKAKMDLVLAADVLYERANLRWLDRFLEFGKEVFVADSRHKELIHPHYRVWGKVTTTSFPDYQEAKAYNVVTCYYSEVKDQA